MNDFRNAQCDKCLSVGCMDAFGICYSCGWSTSDKKFKMVLLNDSELDELKEELGQEVIDKIMYKHMEKVKIYRTMNSTI